MTNNSHTMLTRTQDFDAFEGNQKDLVVPFCAIFSSIKDF